MEVFLEHTYFGVYKITFSKRMLQISDKLYFFAATIISIDMLCVTC